MIPKRETIFLLQLNLLLWDIADFSTKNGKFFDIEKIGRVDFLNTKGSLFRPNGGWTGRQ